MLSCYALKIQVIADVQQLQNLARNVYLRAVMLCDKIALQCTTATALEYAAAATARLRRDMGLGLGNYDLGLGGLGFRGHLCSSCSRACSCGRRPAAARSRGSSGRGGTSFPQPQQQPRRGHPSIRLLYTNLDVSTPPQENPNEATEKKFWVVSQLRHSAARASSHVQLL